MTSRSNRAALAFVGLAALSLVGIPLLLRGDDSVRPAHGVVIDERGFGVPGAAVFLFSEQHLQLFEEAHSEEDGDFAFQLEAARPRLFVRPSAESGLLPAWGLPAEDAAG
ncbi:MAG: hypothetical protein HOP15_01600, partial [Planctomycetes bacterium]|nr:hypothetical protein [Planctomycetota bacterium]